MDDFSVAAVAGGGTGTDSGGLDDDVSLLLPFDEEARTRRP